MRKLLNDKEYIACINVLDLLEVHLLRRYNLSDAELQKLRREIHKLIEKAVGPNDN